MKSGRIRYGTKNDLKRKRAHKLLFSFLSSNYGATTVVKVSQLSM